MNSIIVGAIGISLLYLGYKFYAGKIESLWDINPHKKTPAHTHHDGVDFVPAQHWTILFGHNFSSIAGAGPIIGPVIACAYWGWFGALIWVVVGTIFIGGVHDLSALMSSIRHRGKSMAEVAEKVMGKKTKIIFASFLWLALLLVVAVFSAVTASTIVSEPRIVIPTFGLIFWAVFYGLMTYKFNIRQVIATPIGIAGMAALMIIGVLCPITIPASNAQELWIVILLIYCYVASILPVNLLLQPRDYLSAFLLLFGLAAGFGGIVLSHPNMQAPAFIAYNTVQGPLWPMMFVVIACGAVSGFHSLVASGTTSKQLANEKDAKIISYGGMVMEGVVAVMAIICVAAGLAWTNSSRSSLVFPEIMKNEGWIVAFAKGFGQITFPILGAYGALIAMTTLNSFVLTTLDTSTRIARYITEELFGEGFRVKALSNRYFSTLMVVIIAGWLAFGNWQKIWPVFGASNQLIAALTLIIASAFLLTLKKSAAYTLYPGIFMLLTSSAALVYQFYGFLQVNNHLLAVVTAILLVLTFTMMLEAWQIFRKKAKIA